MSNRAIFMCWLAAVTAGSLAVVTIHDWAGIPAAFVTFFLLAAVQRMRGTNG